jgi:hypothetical protein
MAGLNTMFPQGNLSGTGALEGFTLGDQINMAKQNNLLEQQKAQQEYEQAQKLNPIEVQQKQASLEGTTLDNQTKKQTFDFNKRTEDSRYNKFIDEAAKAHSEAELQQTMAQIQKDLWNPDPKISQAAQHQFQMTADVLKKQLEIKQQGENNIAVANIGASATRYAADKATERASVKAAGGGGKPATTLEGQYVRYLQASQDPESTDAERAQAAQLADLVMQNIINKGNAKAPAMVIDSSGKFVANPNSNPGTIVPTPVPNKPTEKQYSAEDIAFTAKKYGLTEAQVKAKLGIK